METNNKEYCIEICPICKKENKINPKDENDKSVCEHYSCYNFEDNTLIFVARS